MVSSLGWTPEPMNWQTVCQDTIGKALTGTCGRRKHSKTLKKKLNESSFAPLLSESLRKINPSRVDQNQSLPSVVQATNADAKYDQEEGKEEHKQDD